MTEPLPKLDSGQIERQLAGRRVGRAVLCFDEVDSTNDVAWDSSRQGGADGLVILAESQRRGRGRHGRQWISPPGRNILMSVLLIDGRLFRLQEALTVAAGLAVAEGIEKATGLRAELKWPNDVLLGGRKVAGVLVECRQVAGKDAIVVGMGINVAAAPPAELVDAPATCLADSFEDSLDRAAVICEVLGRLDEWIAAVAGEDIEPLHEAWVSRCGMLGQRVAVEYGGRRIVGRVLDVSPMDGLVLVDDRGTNLHLPAAGTTILPNTDK